MICQQNEKSLSGLLGLHENLRQPGTLLFVRVRCLLTCPLDMYPEMAFEKQPLHRTCMTRLADALDFSCWVQILRNVASNPEDPRFRRIKRDNENFQRALGRFEGGIQILLSSGFRMQVGEFLMRLDACARTGGLGDHRHGPVGRFMFVCGPCVPLWDDHTRLSAYQPDVETARSRAQA